MNLYAREESDTNSEGSRLKKKSNKWKSKRNNQGKDTRECYRCRKKGHIKRNCRAKKKTTFNKKCSHCNKKGHEEAQCWKKHPDQIGLVMEEETAFMTFEGIVPVETVQEDSTIKDKEN